MDVTGFFALARDLPGARFHWLDIEDDAEGAGDREVENFPLPPQHEHLKRLLQTLERS